MKRRALFRLVLGAALAPAISVAQTPPDRPDITVRGDRVEVRLAALEVRGVDRKGEPFTALAAEDFTVTVAGEPVEIEAVEVLSAVPPGEPAREPASGTLPSGELLEPLPDIPARPEPASQLLVFLVQSDFHPTRLPGHRAFLGSADKMLAGLGPADRAAVFAFGSRLDLELDLSADQTAIISALRRGARLERATEKPGTLDGPLGRRLDPHAASRVVSAEQALEQIALTLVDRDESIVVILVGWGLGQYRSDGVEMTPSWRRAWAALTRIGAPLLAVDISNAVYHDLELGMIEGARTTGGAYLRANTSPSGVAQHIAKTLSTRVRVWVRVPAETPEDARVEVDLRRGAGTLLMSPRTLPGR